MADWTFSLCLHGHRKVGRDAVTQINEVIGLYSHIVPSKPNNFLIHTLECYWWEDLGCELLARFADSAESR